MRDRGAVAIAVLCAAFVPATISASDVVTRTLAVSPGVDVELAVPAGWVVSTDQDSGAAGVAVRFSPAGGDQFVGRLRLQAGSGSAGLGLLRVAVEKQAAKFAEQAGVGAPAVLPLDGPQFRGYWFAISEPVLRPNEYQHLVWGGGVVGGAAVVTFSLLSNLDRQAGERAMLQMVQTLALAEGSAAPLEQSSAGVVVRPADTDEARTLQGAARRQHAAMWAPDGDVGEIVALTYPPALDASGGPDRVHAVLNQVRESSRKLRVEQYDLYAQPTIIVTAKRTYGIVPTRTVVAGPSGRLESHEFLLAILEPGADGWRYLAGSSLTEALRRSWFPDFPATYRLPRVSRERLAEP